MILTSEHLAAAIRRMDTWHFRASDWRKLANGRIVRFVNYFWRTRGVR